MGPPAAPAERTATTFADALARSGLLTPEYAARLCNTGSPPADVAAELVESGDLTEFQAAKLLRGQWHGLVLERYAILAPLGRGGMGIVYLARELGPPETKFTRPLVALKILPPRKADTEPRTMTRFLREMALGEFVPPHPNIARVIECGRAGGVNYIAMEFVPGDTLRALVAEAGPLPVPGAAGLFVQIATALEAAHAAGLIHRDLKPSNVMVTPAGAAKVLDFGFALRRGETLPDDPAIVGGPGYALGTMDYIAPEQAVNGIAATPASDLYSLGCSLYFALGGCPPFPGGSAAQKIRWHRSEPPPPLRSLNPAVPADLAAVIDKLMSKEPGGRYPDAAAVRSELGRWANGAPLPIARPVLSHKEAITLSADDLWDPDDSVGPAANGRSTFERLRLWLPEWMDQSVLIPIAAMTGGLALFALAVAAAFLIRKLLR
jgi:eukaryotic-like serine/threonine-protein kinase